MHASNGKFTHTYALGAPLRPVAKKVRSIEHQALRYLSKVASPKRK